jgi:hypothetical protein
MAGREIAREILHVAFFGSGRPVVAIRLACGSRPNRCCPAAGARGLQQCPWLRPSRRRVSCNPVVGRTGPGCTAWPPSLRPSGGRRHLIDLPRGGRNRGLFPFRFLPEAEGMCGGALPSASFLSGTPDRRLGRFPDRNRASGRVSTPEERVIERARRSKLGSSALRGFPRSINHLECDSQSFPRQSVSLATRKSC